MIVRFSLAALVAAFLAGCSGGEGSGLADQPPLPPFGASSSAIQANVLAPTCAAAGCHQGAGAPQGLRLDDVNSYGLLVNVASSQVNTILRVAPNDPDNSYLIQKLEGTASVCAQMPLNAPALTQSTIDVIRQWITDGAIDDRTASAGPIVWLAQADWISDEVAGQQDLDGIAGFFEANWMYQKGQSLRLSYDYFDPDNDLDEDHQVRYSLVWEYNPMQFVQGRFGIRVYDSPPQSDLANRDEFFAELHGFF